MDHLAPVIAPCLCKKKKKKTVVSLATFVALQVWYGIPNERVPDHSVTNATPQFFFKLTHFIHPYTPIT